MGRTKRKRNVLRARTFYTCNNNKDLIKFSCWLAIEGVRYNKKLVLAVFEDTGRGVLTKKRIRSGEELINLPLNLTINVTTLLFDVQFCNIFLENNISCLLEYEKKVSFQCLLAFYLTFLMAMSKESKWHIYLESLPKNYTVPYFLPNEVKKNLHPDIIAVITKQINVIESSYSIFVDVLKNMKSVCPTSKQFMANFTLANYEWAYFTVNTRCVYMDLTKLVDLIHIQNSILNVVSDNMNISLCPFLDMLNHSPNAKNEAKLIVNNDISNVSVNNVEPNVFSDVNFSIYTKNSFEAYTQVFICYGDSHNIKLITEYGFYLPNNELDCVSFDFDCVKSFMSSNSIKLSRDQVSFIYSHGLNKDLYIDIKGLSYNFYALLMVVKYYYDKSKDVNKLIYSAAICLNDDTLNNLIKPMVIEKLVCIKESVSRLMASRSSCVILGNCVSLMNNYVKILEEFIKC